MEIAFYEVIEDIAIRSGLILERYRTVDMHWILDNKDLGRVRFTPDEYIDGLKGVEKISGERADTLIAENGYKMGYEGLDVDDGEGEGNVEENNNSEEQEVVDNGDEQPENVDEETFNEEENTETPTPTTEETITNDEVGNVEDILGGGDDENENNVEQQNEEE